VLFALRWDGETEDRSEVGPNDQTTERPNGVEKIFTKWLSRNECDLVGITIPGTKTLYRSPLRYSANNM
jgi:hypothetical protein